MGNSDDLRNILEKLKKEAGVAPLPAAPAAPEPPAETGWFSGSGKAAAAPVPAYSARPPAARPRPYGVDVPQEPHAVSPATAAWRENKEAMLFGVLTSLVMTMGGVLAGLEYLVYLGAFGFLAFSGVMALSLLGAAMPARDAGGDPRLNARVDTLSRKVDLLAEKVDAPPGGGKRI